MSRRTRRKYYKRRHGRWSPNIVKIGAAPTVATGEWYWTDDLVENTIPANSGVTQSFTVKNFEISFTLETDISSFNALDNITAYIMYVPQGMSPNASYYAQHPEYIMAYKYLGSPYSPSLTLNQSGNQVKAESQQFQPIKVRTRMSRRLQTGDKIVLYLQGSAETGGGTFNVSGIVRWWSKAN